MSGLVCILPSVCHSGRVEDVLHWWFAEQTTPKVISEKAAARAAVCVRQLGSVRYVCAYRKCKKKGIIFAEPMSQTDKSLIQKVSGRKWFFCPWMQPTGACNEANGKKLTQWAQKPSSVQPQCFERYSVFHTPCFLDISCQVYIWSMDLLQGK